MNQIAILHFAAPPIVGGVESTIYHHARLLVEAGYRIEVIAGRGETFHPEVTFHSIPEIDSRHWQVLRVGQALARGDVPPEFIVLRDQLVDQLRPILTQAGVCLVHNAITLHKNLPLTAALRVLSDEKQTPFVAWSHDFAWQDTLYTPELHPGYPWDLLRSPWPGVRYVVVSAHRQSRLAQLLGIPENDIQVIHPGVNVDQFFKLAPLTLALVKRLELLEADPLMLLPARITRRKNIQFAIQVTAALNKSKPRAALVVTGPPGPHNPKNITYLASLLELRSKLGVAEQAIFLYEHGENDQPLHVTDEVIADFYRLADLLIFPSRSEGFGIPVLEAGLARLPVFAADIPPVKESAGGLAQLFDPGGDPQAVAQAILAYLEKDQAYQLRRRVLSQFTWKAILNNRLIPLIKEVAKA